MFQFLVPAGVVSLLAVSANCCEGWYRYGYFFCTNSYRTEIPDDIPEDAKQVFLYDNMIGQLEADTFSGFYSPQWEVLSFSHNNISIVEPGAFNGLQNLRELYLDENQISAMTLEMWQELLVLESLHLKDNWISELKANQWVGLGTLTRVNLQNNLITHVLEGVWNGLSHLERLSLSGNKLREIQEDMWQGLDSET